MNVFKRLIYKVAEQDSRNMGKVGNFFNWKWLEDEADRNTKNPGRAIGKAAGAAASMYLGGLLGGAAGGAGGAAGNAGSAAGAAAPAAGAVAAGAMAPAAGAAGNMAAQEAALLAMQQGGLLAAENAPALAGVTGGLNPAMAGTELGAAIPQGFANTMEAGMANTGYTPSSFGNALRLGPGSGQGMGQTLQNYAANKGAMGLLGDGLNGINKFNKVAGQTGLLGGQPQQAPAPPPPPPPQQQPMQQQPSQFGYRTDPTPPPGVDPMEWARMSPEQKRALMAQRGMA